VSNVFSDELEILNAQINRIREKALKKDLDINETRKLEILVKMRNVVLSNPHQASDDFNYTDKEVLVAIKKGKEIPKRKRTPAKSNPKLKKARQANMEKARKAREAKLKAKKKETKKVKDGKTSKTKAKS